MPAANRKVSVVTVCYNSGVTIEDTLKSVKMQTYENLEHVLVDGGSSDNTLDIIKRHSERVSVCVSEPDRGLYDACNKGLKLATGDVIGFLNSDDYYPTPDIIGTVAAVFEDPAIDACYGDLCYVNQFEINKIVRFWRSKAFKPGLFVQGWVPPHPTFFVRKSVYDRFGGFNLEYTIAADWELLARLLEVHSIRAVYIPIVMVHMRLGGLSNRSWRHVLKQNVEIWHAAKSHGLKVSLVVFVANKIWSRGLQFITTRET